MIHQGFSPNVPLKNAICLIVDRLHAGYLGAYGNTWIATGEFDRLACQSLLLDHATIDCPHLAMLYRAYLCGSHAMQPVRKDENVCLIDSAKAAGIHTVLLTDDKDVAELEYVREFDELILLQSDEVTAVATSLEETQTASFYFEAIERLTSLQQPFLLWLHDRGMSGPWDAPLELRNRYADEDDPTPLDTAEAPCVVLDEDDDPDELLRIRHAYAGQVTLWDTCLGTFFDALSASPHDSNTLFAVVGARGFPLGEHRRVGTNSEALYGELIHVPWVLRYPNTAGLVRSPALAQPPDLAATLFDWWEIEVDASTISPVGSSLQGLLSAPNEVVRDRACAVAAAGECGIRTPAWYLRCNEVEGKSCHELFVKPDDRWAMSDVSSRAGEIVKELQAACEAFEKALHGEPSKGLLELPPLPSELLRQSE